MESFKLESFKLIARIAFRNLWLYRVKTLVIGALLAAGAFIAVLGLSLLRDVSHSMQQSITESVAGHLQLYSAEAKDELAVFGAAFMGRPDIGELEDLARYREIALAHPNVKAFVPMGIDFSMLGRGNEMDDAVDALRLALKGGEPAIISDRVEQVRFQIEQLRHEFAERKRISTDAALLATQDEALQRASAAGFDEALARGDEDSLQFLETRIAPISGEKVPIYLMYFGTDIKLYSENFSKFHLVDGESLPIGKRGILISNRVREGHLKNMAGRLLDKLEKRVRAGITIASDAENQRVAADLSRQVHQVMAYLDRKEATSLSEKLARFGIETDAKAEMIARLSQQLERFLTVDDATILARHRWFYDEIAPMVRMYEISPGDTIVVRSYTKSGYVKSVGLKVYGVYAFSGLEDSELAGAVNIMDLVSFRELYGQISDETRQEIAAMEAEVKLRDVSADEAEAALFGSDAPSEDPAVPDTDAEVDDQAAAVPSAPLRIQRALEESFDPVEIQKGLALNAALILKDFSKLEATKAELSESLKKAGLKVRVVDWKEASGMVGQFVGIMQLVLIFALVVIFVVTLVIINNSIIVGTINRIREIGTMRALGAQKGFVLALFLTETWLTGLIASLVGVALGAMVLIWLSHEGIPAANDIVTFMFSGPKLYPQWRWKLGLIVIIGVTGLATLTSLYAARYSARIRPADAMQEKD